MIRIEFLCKIQCFCVWALGLQMDSDVWFRQFWTAAPVLSFPLVLFASVCPFLSFLPILTPHVSIPFFFPACTPSVCFLSTRLFVCQPVSQTGIPEQKAAAASALFTLLHPSVHPSVAGLCPF